MGMLTIFRKKQVSTNTLFNKEDVEGITVEALRRFNESKNEEVIKKLEDDKEFLKKQLEEANKRILILEGKEVKVQGKTSLSKLEKGIYELYLKKKPKSFEAFVKLSKESSQNLRVYISRIRKKGHSLEFEE